MLIIIRYIEVSFTFSLVDCVRYNEDFVKSRFCSIHFTVILAGLKKIVHYSPRTSLYRGSLNRGATIISYEYSREETRDGCIRR